MKMVELGSHATITCKDLQALPLESVAGVPAMVLESVGPIHHAVRVPFHDSQARKKAILIRTDWDSVEHHTPGPYLHEDLVFRLIRARVRLVGVDFDGVDTTDLIANDIVVVQNLAFLKSIPKTGFCFFAVPPPAEGKCAAVRAFAEINGA
jgi:kynurenine formamidase